MNHVWTNLTVHAETMTALVLILSVALAKAIRNLSKRLSQSRLTLETDSFVLHMQTPPDSLRQELPPLEQGGDDNGRSENDNGGIPSAAKRPKW